MDPWHGMIRLEKQLPESTAEVHPEETGEHRPSAENQTQHRQPVHCLGVAELIIVVLLVGALVTRGVWRADEWRAFEQRGIESRYKAVARFAREALPERAVFFAFQESGSLRHYAERLTLRFDRLAPASLESAITFLTARGYQPYFVIEDPETTPFRNRFRRASPLGELDWPPVAELRGPVRVQIFDPADRARWFAGERLFPRRIEP